MQQKQDVPNYFLCHIKMGTGSSVPDVRLSLNHQLIYLNNPQVAGALLLKAFENETRACAFALTVNEYIRQCIAQTVESPKSQVIADLYAALHGAYDDGARDMCVEALQNLFMLDATWKDFCPTSLPDTQKSPWRVFMLPGDAAAAYAVLPLWSALCCVVRGETACLLLNNEICTPPTKAAEMDDLTGGMPRTSPTARKSPKAPEGTDKKKLKALAKEKNRQKSERQTKVATARKVAAVSACRVTNLTQPIKTDKIANKEKVKQAIQGSKQNVPILPQGYVQAVNWEGSLTKEDEKLTKSALRRVSGSVNALKVVEELEKQTPPEKMGGGVWSFLMKHKLKIGFGVVLVGFAFMLHTMVVGNGSGIASYVEAALHTIDSYIPVAQKTGALFQPKVVKMTPEEFHKLLYDTPRYFTDSQSRSILLTAGSAFYGVSYS